MGKHVCVYVDLDEFDDDELVDEVESRGFVVNEGNGIDYEKIACNIITKKLKGQDVTKDIDDLLYALSGQAITGF